jgi:PiT family inorganic phosphate transporter
MVIVWLLLLPSAAIVGVLAGWVVGTGTAGTVVVAVARLAIGGGTYALSRRQPMGAHNVNEVPAGPSRVAAALA